MDPSDRRSTMSTFPIRRWPGTVLGFAGSPKDLVSWNVLCESGNMTKQKIMNGQNFNFAAKFTQNVVLAPNFAFLDKKFWTRRLSNSPKFSRAIVLQSLSRGKVLLEQFSFINEESPQQWDDILLTAWNLMLERCLEIFLHDLVHSACHRSCPANTVQPCQHRTAALGLWRCLVVTVRMLDLRSKRCEFNSPL